MKPFGGRPSTLNVLFHSAAEKRAMLALPLPVMAERYILKFTPTQNAPAGADLVQAQGTTSSSAKSRPTVRRTR